MSQGPALPVVISVPHGGTEVPREVRHLLRLSMQDILRDGDTWSGHLYDLSGHVVSYVDTDIARAALDMNRSPDDRPPENPDGVVKTTTVGGVQVWEDPTGLPHELADRIIEKYHRPYHDRIEAASRKKTAILGIDCHTMLSRAPLFSDQPGAPRPMICISNGGDGTGEPRGEPLTAPPDLTRALRDAVATAFRHEDVTVDIGAVLLNDPFRGGYLCRRHGISGTLPWVQFEINRALYLPDTLGLTKRPDAEHLTRLGDLREKFIRGLKRIL